MTLAHFSHNEIKHARNIIKMATSRAVQKCFNYSDETSGSNDEDFSSSDSVKDPDYDNDGFESETSENEEIMVSK